MDELETVKNSILSKAVSKFLTLDVNDDYKDNLNKLVNYFMLHPSVFLTYLTKETYDVLHKYNECHDVLPDIQKAHLFREDYITLIRLGVIDLINDDVIDVNQAFNEVIAKAMELDEKIEYDKVQIIFGMMEIYGCLSLDEAFDFLNKYNVKFNSIEEMSKFINSQGLLIGSVSVDGGRIYRIELESNLDDFCEVQDAQLNVVDYKPYTLTQVNQFAYKCYFEDELPIEHDRVMELFLQKAFSSTFSLGMDIENEDYSDDDKYEVAMFERTYPKWILKGNTLQDMVEMFQPDLKPSEEKTSKDPFDIDISKFESGIEA